MAEPSEGARSRWAHRRGRPGSRGRRSAGSASRGDERVTAHDGERQLAVFVRDADGELIAGVYGWTWGGCARLQHLWVDEPLRSQGLAGRLLGGRGRSRPPGLARPDRAVHPRPTPAGRATATPGEATGLVGRVDDYPVGDAAWFTGSDRAGGPMGRDPRRVACAPHASAVDVARRPPDRHRTDDPQVYRDGFVSVLLARST